VKASETNVRFAAAEKRTPIGSADGTLEPMLDLDEDARLLQAEPIGRRENVDASVGTGG